MLVINLTMYYIFPFYKLTIITQTMIALPQNQLIFVDQSMNSQRILEKVTKRVINITLQIMTAEELKEGKSELVQFTQNLHVKCKQAIKWSHPDRFTL